MLETFALAAEPSSHDASLAIQAGLSLGLGSAQHQ